MVANEWAGFAAERKTLRVSFPRGIQRSSYFISVPLRYGIPIMALFATEHWLLSQSAFIIRVINFSWHGVETTAYTKSAYSTIPGLFGSFSSLPSLTPSHKTHFHRATSSSLADRYLAFLVASSIILVQSLNGYLRRLPQNPWYLPAAPIFYRCSGAMYPETMNLAWRFALLQRRGMSEL